MKKHTAHDILIKITETLLKYLEELSCLEKSNEFAYGERVAYIECLEMIQRWEHADKNGLDFDIEARYPL